jgi:hypothetical protein
MSATISQVQPPVFSKKRVAWRGHALRLNLYCAQHHVVADWLHLLVEEGQSFQGFPIVESYMHLVRSSGQIGGELKLMAIEDWLVRGPIAGRPRHDPARLGISLGDDSPIGGD